MLDSECSSLSDCYPALVPAGDSGVVTARQPDNHMAVIDVNAHPAYIALMKQITIRSIPERSIERARSLARERDLPLNHIYVEAMNRGLGLGDTPVLNGLQKYAADSDFGPEWDDYLEDLKQVDPKDWE